MTLEELFNLHDSIIPDERGCRRWPLGLNSGGYPQKSMGGTTKLPTRLILERKLGRSLRPGLRACHDCDNRWCFSAEHLYEATQLQNLQDAVSRGRMPRGELVPSSKLTEETVRNIRKYAEEHPEETQRYVANRFNISQTNIRRILNRETWKHV